MGLCNCLLIRPALVLNKSYIEGKALLASITGTVGRFIAAHFCHPIASVSIVNYCCASLIEYEWNVVHWVAEPV